MGFFGRGRKEYQAKIAEIEKSISELKASEPSDMEYTSKVAILADRIRKELKQADQTRYLNELGY